MGVAVSAHHHDGIDDFHRHDVLSDPPAGFIE
jgi:hypothetical protein